MSIGSYITKKEIGNFSEDEIKLFQELINVKENLKNKCDEVNLIDKSISKLSHRIKEINFQVENKSSVRKIGYGFAGTTVALFLCPLSWIAGTFLFAASMFEGDDHSTSDSAKFLYVAPVKLCGSLFAKAIREKKQWQASLEKRTQEKPQLENNRLKVFNDINALNEQLKTQLSKITGIGNFKIPRLLHESILIGERVQHLSGE